MTSTKMHISCYSDGRNGANMKGQYNQYVFISGGEVHCNRYGGGEVRRNQAAIVVWEQ